MMGMAIRTVKVATEKHDESKQVPGCSEGDTNKVQTTQFAMAKQL